MAHPTSVDKPAFLPADLVFVRGSSWFSRAIRWATRSRGEEKTWCNHVGGMLTSENICEALARVEIRKLELVEGEYEVWRHTRLTFPERLIVASYAEQYADRKYGWPKLIPHLMDAGLSKIFCGEVFAFRGLLGGDQYPICSWLWAWAYAKGVGYWFGVSPRVADPDHMHDHVREHRDWKLVWRQS